MADQIKIEAEIPDLPAAVRARVFELFTPAQLIGLGIVPVGIILLIYFLRHEPKNPDLQH